MKSFAEKSAVLLQEEFLAVPFVPARFQDERISVLLFLLPFLLFVSIFALL